MSNRKKTPSYYFASFIVSGVLAAIIAAIILAMILVLCKMLQYELDAQTVRTAYGIMITALWTYIFLI